MKLNIYKILAIFAALALSLSACSGAATPDAAAIATSAVQTVEARYTQQAAQDPTQTSTSTPAITATFTPDAQTPETQDTPLPTMLPQTPQANGKPCYAASVVDITIVDGALMLPGATFTKTWRLLNLGNCPWDSTYALVFDSGDAMSTVLKFPLANRVYPGSSIDISVPMTAPQADGLYTGYWRIATPYGGTFGVGQYDQSIFAQIHVSSKPDKSFAVTSVTYDWRRDPPAGCDSKGGMRFTVIATVTVNSAGTLHYQWNRNPYDGGPKDGGDLKFDAAGSHVVEWTWTLKSYSIHDIDRWIAFDIDSPPSMVQQYGKVLFNFTCK